MDCILSRSIRLQFNFSLYSCTEIKLFNKPEYFASPPTVLERINFGLNFLINLGITSAPFTKEPTRGNSKFYVGVITASRFCFSKFSSRYPCGSI